MNTSNVKPLAILVVCALPGLLMADRMDTGWHWGSWTVETGEELFWGSKHTSYPAPYLFDDDPSTAWVFSGVLPEEVDRLPGDAETRNSWKEQMLDGEKNYGSRFWLTIDPKWPVTLDGLRIMNGYNKSAEVFQKNRRIVEVEIWAGNHWPRPGEKPLTRVRLSDDMGWHNIPFPPTRFDQGQGLTIRFTKFVGAPSLDVAVSGLELLKNGKAIDLHVPQIVDFTTGADCG